MHNSLYHQQHILSLNYVIKKCILWNMSVKYLHQIWSRLTLQYNGMWQIQWARLWLNIIWNILYKMIWHHWICRCCFIILNTIEISIFIADMLCKTAKQFIIFLHSPLKRSWYAMMQNKFWIWNDNLPWLICMANLLVKNRASVTRWKQW